DLTGVTRWLRPAPARQPGVRGGSRWRCGSTCMCQLRAHSRKKRPNADPPCALWLVGAHDVKALASLQHALRRDLQGEILRERGAHELRQRIVLGGFGKELIHESAARTGGGKPGEGA